MGSSQGSTISADVMSLVDTLPVLAKTLIAGGAAGAFAKTAVAPLERIKILLQVKNLILAFLDHILFQSPCIYHLIIMCTCAFDARLEQTTLGPLVCLSP